MQLPAEPQVNARLSKAIDTHSDVIRATERERLRALAQRDMHTVEQLHADNFQLITPGGSALSKAQYLDRIASGRIAYLVCEPETMDVRMYDDAAVIRYQSRLEVRIGGTPDSGRFGIQTFTNNATANGKQSGRKQHGRREHAPAPSERAECQATLL